MRRRRAAGGCITFLSCIVSYHIVLCILVCAAGGAAQPQTGSPAPSQAVVRRPRTMSGGGLCDARSTGPASGLRNPRGLLPILLHYTVCSGALYVLEIFHATRSARGAACAARTGSSRLASPPRRRSPPHTPYSRSRSASEGRPSPTPPGARRAVCAARTGSGRACGLVYAWRVGDTELEKL